MAHIAAQIMTNESVYDTALGSMAHIAAQFSGYGASDEHRFGRPCVAIGLFISIAYGKNKRLNADDTAFLVFLPIFWRENAGCSSSDRLTRPTGGNFVAAAARKIKKEEKQGAMIAPYDPHAPSATVMAAVFFRNSPASRQKDRAPPELPPARRTDGGRFGKISKGTMIVPLDPCGFFWAVVGLGKNAVFWGISEGERG